MGREDEVVSPRLHDQIAHCHRGEMVAFELCPGLPTIDRNPEAELRPEKKHLFFACVFFNDMRVAADAFAFLGTNEWCPCLAVIGRLKNIRLKIAEAVAVESG